MAATSATLPAAVPTVANASLLAAEEWERLVWTHARLLYRISFAALRNHHDAEDAVQETLQRAWKYRARLAAVENPAAWLARIAWRVAKSRRPRPGMIPLDAPAEGAHAGAAAALEAVITLRAGGAGAEELAARREMQALTEKMIQHLPRKLRQPLLLSTVEELSAREVGAVLGIPEASVRTRCLRARRLLKEKLEAALQPRTGGRHAGR